MWGWIARVPLTVHAASGLADALRLNAHHFPHAHQGLVYAAAGRLLGAALPYQAATNQQSGYGGTARADATALADLWPHILRLLAHSRKH